jgi:hypothetical protein
MTRLPHPPLRFLDSAEALGRVKASLAALAAGAALTRPPRFARKAFIGAAGILGPKGGTPMLDRSLKASISVTIGRLECLYDAVITTAPATLDLPDTITLLADTLLELSCYAVDPFSLDTTRSKYAARLVLADTLKREWQCATYEGNGHLVIAADPRMADFNTLQQLVWRLLLTASLNQAAA